MLVPQKEQLFSSLSKQYAKLVEDLPFKEAKIPMTLPKITMPVITPSHFETVILSSNQQTEEPTSAKKSNDDDTKLKGIDPTDAKPLEDNDKPEFYM